MSLPAPTATHTTRRVDAARHVCEEVRVVLSSLRTGPPDVAHGVLVRDLTALRTLVRTKLLDSSSANSKSRSITATSECAGGEEDNKNENKAPSDEDEPNNAEQEQEQEQERKENNNEDDPSSPIKNTSPPRTVTVEPFTPSVGQYAAPFLAVVTDPRAAGPHTLVALRALHRLAERGSLSPPDGPHVSVDRLARGVLECRFEQTDAGADEAVEMAIADLLRSLLSVTEDSIVEIVSPSVFLEAFHAVLVTRNTFVHSPALCYHFEDVLNDMVRAALQRDDDAVVELMLDFLVGQLLHTPAVLHGGGSEAQAAHDATRVLCIRLSRVCVTTGWGSDCEEGTPVRKPPTALRDGLCLALLQIGQARWEEEEERSDGSLEILNEVCATVSALWSIATLRPALRPQLEAIFGGIFQRALSLLRRRQTPRDGDGFASNLLFDAEIEIVLQTLVDLLCLHDEGSSSTLETLFQTYDCDANRSDVAAGLVEELCRCCGGVAGDVSRNEETEGQPRYRPVPAHLKELCGEALIGFLKCLFRDVGVFGSSSSNDASPPSSPPPSSSLRHAKQQKRLLKGAVALLNSHESATPGLKYLSEHGLLSDPPSPCAVAEFLRNAVVVGLDKAAAGRYLGAAGTNDRRKPAWDQPDFHQKVLAEYCATFHFDGTQTLLEGLRMFLSSFRLPGEAQQIDRILQAFAESHGRKCRDRSDFCPSDDDKRAVDTAYLLTFSLIMLNTDLHNDNVRADRKMTKSDFVRNNTNYGRDISGDHDMPRELLETYYDDIKEVQLRTEAEGAEGIMMVERWRDVVGGGGGTYGGDTVAEEDENDNVDPRERALELKRLILEGVADPILGAICGFWGVLPENDEASSSTPFKHTLAESGMLGAQGSRLGIDMALQLLAGVRAMRLDELFRDTFTRICRFSGLLRRNNTPILASRAAAFADSVERQSAVIVAVRVAKEAGDDLGVEGWRSVWGILFEMRDYKMGLELAVESDPDLLTPEARATWWNERSISLWETATGATSSGSSDSNDGGGPGIGLLGRLFFGDEEDEDRNRRQNRRRSSLQDFDERKRLMIWNDTGSNHDDNYDDNEDLDHTETDDESNDDGPVMSVGAAFENQLIHEDNDIVTDRHGRSRRRSRRSRVRRRLATSCDFAGLVSGSRYLSSEGISHVLAALVETIRRNEAEDEDEDRFPVVSPASEALAEVLICEITIKNRDRFGHVWDSVLRDHYRRRLSGRPPTPKGTDDCEDDGDDNDCEETPSPNPTTTSPGIEKCATGLVRVCFWMVNRTDVANEVLRSLRWLHPPTISSTDHHVVVGEDMDGHLGEGLWRVCRNVDGLLRADAEGWAGLLGLARWCATRGGTVVDVGPMRGGLAQDDPALKAYRSLHFLLTCGELEHAVPLGVVESLLPLVASGERGGCAKLVIASLDLLSVFHNRLGALMSVAFRNEADGNLWSKAWLVTVDGIAETATSSGFVSVRHHAISMLTDIIVDRHGSMLTEEKLVAVVNGICVPLSAARITSILNETDTEGNWEDTMIELEMCLRLIFKPFLHYLKTLRKNKANLVIIWRSILETVALLLNHDAGDNKDGAADDEVKDSIMTLGSLLVTTKELASEHLRNGVIVLAAYQIVTVEPDVADDEISAMTWNLIRSMKFCSDRVEEWKESARSHHTHRVGDESVNAQEITKEVSDDDAPESIKKHDSEVSEDDSYDMVHVSDGGEDTCETGG